MFKLTSFLTAILVSALFLGTSQAVAEISTSSAAMSAEITKPLGVGTTIPDSNVRTTDGSNKTLHQLTNNKPSVLIFYRGGWCPYCNTQLGEIGNIEPQLREMGFQIFAISPDRPEKLKASMNKHKLSYELLSDSKMQTALAFGLAFKVDDKTVALYKNEYDIDIEADSGEKHHLLPVPSAYVVDSNGKIVFSYSNPDYKVRVDKDKLLEAAKSLITKNSSNR